MFLDKLWTNMVTLQSSMFTIVQSYCPVSNQVFSISTAGLTHNKLFSAAESYRIQSKFWHVHELVYNFSFGYMYLYLNDGINCDLPVS